MDAQEQREATAAADPGAGDGDGGENLDLVVPAVLRHLEGIWGELEGGNRG